MARSLKGLGDVIGNLGEHAHAEAVGRRRDYL
jgi:hypothetical protein